MLKQNTIVMNWRRWGHIINETIVLFILLLNPYVIITTWMLEEVGLLVKGTMTQCILLRSFAYQ